MVLQSSRFFLLFYVDSKARSKKCEIFQRWLSSVDMQGHLRQPLTGCDCGRCLSFHYAEISQFTGDQNTAKLRSQISNSIFSNVNISGFLSLFIRLNGMVKTNRLIQKINMRLLNTD